jgi:predicted nucleotidyltransferase
MQGCKAKIQIDICPGPRPLQNNRPWTTGYMCPTCQEIDRRPCKAPDPVPPEICQGTWSYFDFKVGRNSRKVRCAYCRSLDDGYTKEKVMVRQLELIASLRKGEFAQNPTARLSLEVEHLLIGEFIECVGDRVPEQFYAFCITGSLARREMGPHSDIDCFVIAAGHWDVAILQDTANLFCQKLERVAARHHTLVLDKAGISPERLTGTVEQLHNIIMERNDMIFYTSIWNARTAYGNRSLLNDLINSLASTPPPSLSKPGIAELTLSYSAVFTFSRTFDGEQRLKLDLKSHLMRPLMFCVGGLLKFYIDGGVQIGKSPDQRLLTQDITGVKQMAKFLFYKECISEQILEIILETFKALEFARVRIQLEHHEEHDDLRLNLTDGLWNLTLRPAMDNVVILQKCARKFVSSHTATDFENPFLTDNPQKHL